MLEPASGDGDAASPDEVAGGKSVENDLDPELGIVR
jgi:hypothetical protein